jgi:hypothetical protein
MNCVSLVCTVHGETGRASISALRAILDQIQPKVIFLELPPSAYHDHFETSNRANLESIAIKQHCVKHDVDLVLVDINPPDEDFFRDHKNLYERTKERSNEYDRLIGLNTQLISEHGFVYLNCDDCSNLWSDIYAEQLRTIVAINDPQLLAIYELWNKTIDLRDEAMMNNILEYSRGNIFDRGVFLVGAAHRQSIIDKARKQSAVKPEILQWDFSTDIVRVGPIVR